MNNILSIRLQRMGRIKRPYFNIIVIYSHKGPNAGYIDKIGSYDPFSMKFIKENNVLILDKVKLIYWLSKGARPTYTVSKLLF